MAIAGRVAIVPKGEYFSTITYDKLDLVTFNNDTYIAKKASTGIEPTNEEYWMLILDNVVAEELENIINGTTPVAKATDADTVDGKHASDFLSLTGGYLSGYLEVAYNTGNPGIGVYRKENNTQGVFAKVSNGISLTARDVYNSATNERRLYLYDTNGNPLANALGIAEVLNGQAKFYPVLHTGNKPSGSYAGNGSAASRTIQTGGIGTILWIKCAKALGFVWNYGAIFIDGGGTNPTFKWFNIEECKFENGVLTIASTSDYLNRNANMYYYGLL